MISENLLQKQLFTMTGGEILELFQAIKNDMTPTNDIKDFTKDQYVHGLDGLAKLLNCGKTKAQEIKKSGLIDKAIIQNGRKIIIKKELALKLLQDV